MLLRASCPAFLPPALCGQLDLLAYLAPSFMLALLIRQLGRRHQFFLLFYLAGTVCHELAHLCAGFVTGARPRSFTVLPRRVAGGWRLGSVAFANLRWYNAAPTALAPLLILALPFAIAAMRVAQPWTFGWRDAALALLLAPQLLSFWPSRKDWTLALASWPWAALAAAGYGMYRWLQ